MDSLGRGSFLRGEDGAPVLAVAMFENLAPFSAIVVVDLVHDKFRDFVHFPEGRMRPKPPGARVILTLVHEIAIRAVVFEPLVS